MREDNVGEADSPLTHNCGGSMRRRKLLLKAATLWVALLCFENASSQTNDVLRGLDSMKRNMDPGATSKGPIERASPRFQDPESSPWRKVKPGMSETEVMAVLGVPDRVVPQSAMFQWYWDKGAGKGWVSFGNDSRKVIEWRNF